MNPQQIHYMRLLIARVERAPEERIGMETWGVRLDEDCGTAGCLGGYALTIPEFRAAGLFQRDSSVPRFRHFIGEAALGRFFGITNQEAGYLFLKYSYDFCPATGFFGSKQEVLNRLREVLISYSIGPVESTEVGKN